MCEVLNMQVVSYQITHLQYILVHLLLIYLTKHNQAQTNSRSKIKG